MSVKEIHEGPSLALLEEVVAFSRKEAGWNSDLADLKLVLHDMVLVVIRNKALQLISSGYLCQNDKDMFWVGCIVVAKAYRGQGFAKATVSSLAKLFEERRYVSLPYRTSLGHFCERWAVLINL